MDRAIREHATNERCSATISSFLGGRPLDGIGRGAAPTARSCGCQGVRGDSRCASCSSLVGGAGRLAQRHAVITASVRRRLGHGRGRAALENAEGASAVPRRHRAQARSVRRQADVRERSPGLEPQRLSLRQRPRAAREGRRAASGSGMVGGRMSKTNIWLAQPRRRRRERVRARLHVRGLTLRISICARSRAT